MLWCGRSVSFLCSLPPLLFLLPLKFSILRFHSKVTALTVHCRRRVRDLLFVFSGEAMAAEEDSIEQAVAARQERLRALKAAQELLNTPDEDSAQVHDNTNESNPISDETNTNMKFRNYVPHDKQLQEGKLVPPVLPKFEDPVAGVPPPSEKKEDPFVNIAPKKPNWELRRDVQKRLDKLEKRTQKAMLKLMEEQEKQKQLDGDGRNGED
ncbi:uncharacterized protein [Malus domestica]|uniref:uncharacterized protein isoform X1 n=1 Tax=Malus domestica TaxID=3750 RepID=UPI003975291D